MWKMKFLMQSKKHFVEVLKPELQLNEHLDQQVGLYKGLVELYLLQ